MHSRDVLNLFVGRFGTSILLLYVGSRGLGSIEIALLLRTTNSVRVERDTPGPKVPKFQIGLFRLFEGAPPWSLLSSA